MTHYKHKEIAVEANQLQTNLNSVNQLNRWIASFGGTTMMVNDSFDPRVYMDIKAEGHRFRIHEGEWLIRYPSYFEVMPDKVFHDVFVETTEPKPMGDSNLVVHAKRELELIGEKQAIVDAYLNIVRVFSDMGHSGSSAMFAIPVIEHLLSFKPLSELTDDPEDWIHVGEDIWGEKGGIYQNRRNGEAFSKDGGTTYYLLSDGSNSKVQRQMHTSKKVEK